MNIPCLITCVRMVGTLLMLFTAPFSSAFYIIYTISGISDVVDGYVARKTNQTTEFGAKLDSIADILFYAVMVFKIFPALLSKLPFGFWCAVVAVVIVRICAYIVAAVKFKCFASLHTYMNKLTGFASFTLPYAAPFKALFGFCVGVWVLAAIAWMEELIIHIKSKEYNPKVKTILNVA